MQLGNIAKRATKVVIDHSPAILTGMGAAGLVTTSYLAARAGMQAQERISAFERKENGFWIRSSAKERFELTWRLFIPAATVGTVSLACIIGSTTISNRRNAALIGLYTLSEHAFTEYRDQVTQQLGEAAETKVRDVIAQKHVDENPLSDREVIILGGGETLMFDELTSRYFKSDMETVRKAVNDINFQCINDMYASQNEFYSKIGLPSVAGGDDIGWNTDRPLELVYTATISEDGRAAIHLGYRERPFANFAKPW